jgi:hypothetical protein
MAEWECFKIRRDKELNVGVERNFFLNLLIIIKKLKIGIFDKLKMKSVIFQH